VLFNSYEFIFFFFPAATLGFFLCGRARSRMLPMLWLLGASLFFYAWWNPHYIWLLLGSMILNFGIGRAVAYLLERSSALAKWMLGLGVATNLGFLCFYKYTSFIVQNINAGFGAHLELPTIVLPLAISFFTFQQISFLVDIYRGAAPRSLGNPIEYATLVAFFPHLIAGPIVFYRELSPQFADPATYRFRYENLAIGATIFFAGLFKKVVLADNLAQNADAVFQASSQIIPTLSDAWVGLLSYTLQIYFDFSGYSDMAIGLAWILGVKLPLNFNSPYKSLSIIEFWRRWHITLSRFLRDYLYVPLGGNAYGFPRQLINISITMLLAGIWHGAGWNFAIWGGLHGFYLVINHIWRRQIIGRFPRVERIAGYRVFCAVLTFTAVTFAWVFFRSTGWAPAANLIEGLVGAADVGSPVGYSTKAVILIVAGAFIVFLCPNLYQLMNVYRSMRPLHDADERDVVAGVWSRLIWVPSLPWAFGFAVVAIVSIIYVSRTSEFIYFQF
jgi:D-alanyl-lipoteichoic acid acyltransferase DltB (MBOAT superfamily)